MTQEQFEREKQYRVAIALAKTMLHQKIISEEDYCVIDTMLTAKFQPILAGLYP